MRRRSAILSGLALGGCSVLPDRPYQEVRRYALALRRPQQAPPARGPGAPVLLIRVVRAAPGLDLRGLRSIGADGRVSIAYWDEWASPPVEQAEEALRRWMADSGLFAAVIASGSRLDADLVMEAELIRLEAVPAEGIARAGLSVLLLSDAARDPVGQARILGQVQAEGMAPLGADATAPSDQAMAMQAALGEALTRLEAALRPILAARRGGAAVRGR